MSDPNPRPRYKHAHWADVDEDSRRFQALLRTYHRDYQKATDAYLRGEIAEREHWGPSTNPM